MISTDPSGAGQSRIASTRGSGSPSSHPHPSATLDESLSQNPTQKEDTTPQYKITAIDCDVVIVDLGKKNAREEQFAVNAITNQTLSPPQKLYDSEGNEVDPPKLADKLRSWIDRLSYTYQEEPTRSAIKEGYSAERANDVLSERERNEDRLTSEERTITRQFQLSPSVRHADTMQRTEIELDPNSEPYKKIVELIYNYACNRCTRETFLEEQSDIISKYASQFNYLLKGENLFQNPADIASSLLAYAIKVKTSWETTPTRPLTPEPRIRLAVAQSVIREDLAPTTTNSKTTNKYLPAAPALGSLCAGIFTGIAWSATGIAATAVSPILPAYIVSIAVAGGLSAYVRGRNSELDRKQAAATLALGYTKSSGRRAELTLHRNIKSSSALIHSLRQADNPTKLAESIAEVLARLSYVDKGNKDRNGFNISAPPRPAQSLISFDAPGSHEDARLALFMEITNARMRLVNELGRYGSRAPEEAAENSINRHIVKATEDIRWHLDVEDRKLEESIASERIDALKSGILRAIFTPVGTLLGSISLRKSLEPISDKRQLIAVDQRVGELFEPEAPEIVAPPAPPPPDTGPDPEILKAQQLAIEEAIAEAARLVSEHTDTNKLSKLPIDDLHSIADQALRQRELLEELGLASHQEYLELGGVILDATGFATATEDRSRSVRIPPNFRAQSLEELKILSEEYSEKVNNAAPRSLEFYATYLALEEINIEIMKGEIKQCIEGFTGLSRLIGFTNLELGLAQTTLSQTLPLLRNPTLIADFSNEELEQLGNAPRQIAEIIEARERTNAFRMENDPRPDTETLIGAPSRVLSRDKHYSTFLVEYQNFYLALPAEQRSEELDSTLASHLQFYNILLAPELEERANRTTQATLKDLPMTQELLTNYWTKLAEIWRDDDRMTLRLRRRTYRPLVEALTLYGIDPNGLNLVDPS